MEKLESTWRRYTRTKRNNHTRLNAGFKAGMLLLMPLCIRCTSNFAAAHASQDHQVRWRILPNLTMPSVVSKHAYLADPSDLEFFAASMAFTALVYAYHSLNPQDKQQNTFLAVAAMAGLLAALCLDVGILLGIFGVQSWFIVSGLVASDLFHRALDRCSRHPDRKWLGDEKT